MRIIFLDVDGVLNNPATEDRIYGWRGIDPELVQNLKSVYNESNKEEETRIVVSSSWKNDEVREIERGYKRADNIYKVLLERLNNAGMEVLGYTTEEKSSWERGKGILKWIEDYNKDHEPISNYVILDDEEFDFYSYEDLKARFVHTTENTNDELWPCYVGIGLQKQYMEKALKILRGEIGEEKDVGES